MNVLAIDTSSHATAVAAERSGGFTRVHSRPSGPGQAEALMPMIRDVLADAGLEPCDLDRIGVTVGPGGFTGVRSGIAAALGLALALDIAVVGLSSLELVALTAAADGFKGDLAVVMEAGRGEVFRAVYRVGSEAATGRGPEVLVAPGAITSEAALGELAVCGGRAVAGSAAARLASQLATTDATRGHGSGPVLIAIASGDVRQLAAAARLRQPSPAPITPLYLRAPDARPQASFVAGQGQDRS